MYYVCNVCICSVLCSLLRFIFSPICQFIEETVQFLLHVCLLRAITKAGSWNIQTYLNRTTVTPLHQIANVFWFNACSNERLYIVMI